jgi:hypothetical protein
MSRFQAMTNPLLDEELDNLRAEMGLRDSQKAELLRELATMASWLVAQARAGRTIEARGADGVAVFQHPALRSAAAFERLVLAPDEAERLVALLDEDREPSAALRATLKRLAAPRRRPPVIRWSDR